MRKIYLLIILLAFGSASFAQTFANSSFETWRTSTSGSTSSTPVYAPTQWYAFDSLIIAFGETYPYSLLISGPFNAQLFKDSTHVHTGNYAAKVITLKQGSTLGMVPGVLTNSIPAVNVAAAIASMGADFANDISFSGGTAVSQRIKTVSAWVEYFQGVDSTGAHANDTGEMVVEAISYIGGRDSIVGLGTVAIGPGSTYRQITDTIVYTDSTDAVDTIRVSFASSGGATSYADSSTLYVDDVSMTGEAEAVPSVINNNMVHIYPNPATNTLNIDCAKGLSLNAQLYNVGGQEVASKQLMTTNELNIATLPSGLYFYIITDAGGNVVQKGKVTINK